MKLASQFLTLTCGFGLAVAQPALAGFPNNPGFETGDFSGWTQSGNSLADSVTTDAHSGSFAAQFGSPDSLSYISQDFGLVPDQTYAVDFWLKNQGGPAEFRLDFGVTDNGVKSFTTVMDLVNPGDFGWTYYRVLVADPVGQIGTIKFEFENQDPVGYFHLDDVAVLARSDSGGDFLPIHDQPDGGVYNSGTVPDQPVGLFSTGLTFLGLCGLALARRNSIA